MLLYKRLAFKKLIIFFILTILITLLFLLVDIDFSKSNLFFQLKNKLQQNISVENKQNNLVKNEIINLSFDEIYDSEQSLDSFLKINNKIRKGKIFKNKLYRLTEFNFCCEELSRSSMGNKPFAYVEVFENKIILVTGYGEIFYISSDELQNREFVDLNLINSNLKKKVNNKEIFQRSIDGVRGIEIHDDILYLSYMEKINGCYSIKLLSGKLNLSEVIFDSFFDNNECLDPKIDKPFTFGAGGGKIEVLPDGKVLLTVGDFKVYGKAQDEDSIFGKIIEITGKEDYEIISLGHRNPQGLTKTNNPTKLLSTEHGPYAGDEINVVRTNEKLNFGWPIVSYGRHYEEEYYEIYSDIAPLKQPHNKFGYQEPIYYVDFSPFGISDIIQNNYFIEKNRFFVGSLNGNLLYDVVFDDDLKNVEAIYTVKSSNRIRDITYDEQKNVYYLIYEESPKLVVLERNKNN